MGKRSGKPGKPSSPQKTGRAKASIHLLRSSSSSLAAERSAESEAQASGSSEEEGLVEEEIPDSFESEEPLTSAQHPEENDGDEPIDRPGQREAPPSLTSSWHEDLVDYDEVESENEVPQTAHGSQPVHSAAGRAQEVPTLCQSEVGIDPEASQPSGTSARPREDPGPSRRSIPATSRAPSLEASSPAAQRAYRDPLDQAGGGRQPELAPGTTRPLSGPLQDIDPVERERALREYERRAAMTASYKSPLQQDMDRVAKRAASASSGHTVKYTERMETPKELMDWYTYRHAILSAEDSPRPENFLEEHNRAVNSQLRYELVEFCYNNPERLRYRDDNKREVISREVGAAELSCLNTLEAANLQCLREQGVYPQNMPGGEAVLRYFLTEMIYERYRIYSKDVALLMVDATTGRYKATAELLAKSLHVPKKGGPVLTDLAGAVQPPLPRIAEGDGSQRFNPQVQADSSRYKPIEPHMVKAAGRAVQQADWQKIYAAQNARVEQVKTRARKEQVEDAVYGWKAPPSIETPQPQASLQPLQFPELGDAHFSEDEGNVKVPTPPTPYDLAPVQDDPYEIPVRLRYPQQSPPPQTLQREMLESTPAPARPAAKVPARNPSAGTSTSSARQPAPTLPQGGSGTRQHYATTVLVQPTSSAESFILDLQGRQGDLTLHDITALETSLQEASTRGRGGTWTLRDHMTHTTIGHVQRLVKAYHVDLPQDWLDVFHPREVLERLRVVAGHAAPLTASGGEFNPTIPLHLRITQQDFELNFQDIFKSVREFSERMLQVAGTVAMEQDAVGQEEDIAKALRTLESRAKDNQALTHFFNKVQAEKPRNLGGLADAMYAVAVKIRDHIRDLLPYGILRNPLPTVVAYARQPATHPGTTPDARGYGRQRQSGYTPNPAPVAANLPSTPGTTPRASSPTQMPAAGGADPGSNSKRALKGKPSGCNRCNRLLGRNDDPHSFHSCPWRTHPDCNNEEGVSWEDSVKGKQWAAKRYTYLPHNKTFSGTELVDYNCVKLPSKPHAQKRARTSCKSSDDNSAITEYMLVTNNYLSQLDLSIANHDFLMGYVSGRNNGPSLPVSVVLDTGAFHGNYISDRVAQWLRDKSSVAIHPCNSNNIICGANSSWCSTCIGRVEINLILNPEISSTMITLPFTAKVLDAAFDVVIGRPSIKQHNLAIYFPSQFLTLSHKTRSLLAKWVRSRGDDESLPTEPDDLQVSAVMEVRDPPRDGSQASVHIERTLWMQVKKKEELLTPTSDGEAWIREPRDIEEVLPGESSRSAGVEDELDKVALHGPPELQDSIRQVCEEYRHLFSSVLKEQPAQVPPMELKVDQSKWNLPKNKRPYRVQTPVKETALRKILKKLLDHKLIQPSKAQCWSQVLLVAKPNDPGEYRLCIDYRNLNEASRGEHWPLPNIDQVITRLGSKKSIYYGQMDFTSGFWQTCLAKESMVFTAFITFMGLYEWTRVAMGLKGAPSYFQGVMASVVLAGLLYVVCELYIDDLIVHGDSIEVFIANLRTTFQRLSEHNIILNPKKCKFGMESTEFVGHVVDAEGRQMSKEKIKKVMDTARPTTVKELRSFLGLANYFRAHVDHHSERARPLLLVLKKACGSDELNSKKGNSSRKRIPWSEQAEAAFQDLIKAISECPKLYFVDDDERHPIVLCTDASDYGYGAYIYQTVDGVERPIAFSSKTFSKDQCRWNVPEKEAYAIYHAMLHFEYLLRDRKFTLKTDHKNLTYISDNGSPKVIRWKLAIMEFNFDVEHIEGEKNVVADYFSRVRPEDKEIIAMWYCPFDSGEDRLDIIRMCHSWVWAPTSELGQLALSYDRDYLIRMVESGEALNSAIPLNAALAYGSTATPTPQGDDYRQLMKDHQLLDTRKRKRQSAQEEATTEVPQPKKQRKSRMHVTFAPTEATPPTATLPTQPTAEEETAIPGEIEAALAADEAKVQIAGNAERAHVERVHQAFKMTHGYLPGHHGVERTTEKVLQYLRSINQQPWSGIKADVKRLLRECPFCQKMSQIKPVVHTRPFTVASYTPWERINIDAMGPLPETTEGYRHVIVVIDCFTRFVELFPAKSTTAEEGKKAILSCVGRYGIPSEIVTDSGSQFKNETISTLVQMMGSEHNITLAYSKEENAMVERANKEVLRHLAAMVYEKRITDDWIDFLPLVQRIINSSPHSSTGVAPAQLLFGNAIQLDRGVFLPIDKVEQRTPTSDKLSTWVDKMLRKQADLISLAEKLQREKDLANLEKRDPQEYTEFPVNSYVLVAYPHTRMGQRPPVKTMTPYRGPLRVIGITGSRYTLQDLVSLKEEQAHISLLKKFDYDAAITNPVEVALHDTQEFEVEEVLRHRGNISHKSSMEFKVRWKNYAPEHDTWEPWSALKNTVALHAYLRKKGWEKHIPKNLEPLPEDANP